MWIFISYGRGDAAELARQLAEWLRERGYEPWLDVENGIPPGAPFDTEIESGIERSSLLIALLSEWSLRPEGFCRNELLFAQAKHVPILPIRVEDVLPPIQIIALNYVGNTSPPEAVFEQLPRLIPLALRDGDIGRREWPPTSAHARDWWTRVPELNFAEELSFHGASFVGREWLFRDVRCWLERKDADAARILLLTAEVGLGKSALAAQMTARLNVRGVHFCTRSKCSSCQPRSWLRSLVGQLAAQFPSYREAIEALEEPTWQESPVELFRSLVADPLLACQGRIEVREPWVFVLDSLDEAMAESGSAMLNLLAASVARLPEWFRLVITSRPDSRVVESLGTAGVDHWALASDAPANQEDLTAYVQGRLERLAVRGVAVARDPATAQFVLRLADGSFLVARMLTEGLADPRFRLEACCLQDRAGKLRGAYHELFRLRFGDPDDQQDERQRLAYAQYQTQVRPLLDCLVAARAPLPTALLIAASGLDEDAARRGLCLLSQFLSGSVPRPADSPAGQAVPGIEGKAHGPGLRLFHASAIDWLAGEDAHAGNVFAASARKGHQRLADACWSEFRRGIEGMSPYAREHLPTHLANAERWSELTEAVADPDLGLLGRWVERGEGDQGVFCLKGLLDSRSLDPVSAAAVATQLARIHSLRGQYSEARPWLDRALEWTSVSQGRRIRAVALHEIGSLELYGRRHGEAERRYREALRLCERRPAQVDEAAANRVALATVAAAQYRWRRVRRLATRAAREARAVGDCSHALAADRLLAGTLEDLGHYPEALTLLERALETAQARNMLIEEARLLACLGWYHYGRAHAFLTRPDRAVLPFEQACAAARRIHNLPGQLDAFLGLGWCDLVNRATQRARQRFGEVLDRLPEGSHRELLCATEVGLAAADHQEGKTDSALERYAASVQLAETLTFRNWAARGLCGWAGVLWHAGQRSEAEARWKRARLHARRTSPRARQLTAANITLCRSDPATSPR
ncbi:MAG: toll/interleukin-1 receptor domain-containing protein [Lentisphaeria bacterium]|nr:toll/interleukin-1 receptor domain-containing protein [Lentisphaeria bacterium]